MKKYTYHYCAQYQEIIGQIVYTDGISIRDSEITDYDGYVKLKNDISAHQGTKSYITIISLTRLK